MSETIDATHPAKAGAAGVKPMQSLFAIINMAVGFFGLQIGFALQQNNGSRIFQSLGADMESLPLLWLAAPLTGLIVQPIVGYFSDRTWGRLGRRRPYFLAGAILASLALIFMPNSPYLWMAAGSLWVLDAALNISMEPFRAFVGDNLNSRQKATGYALQGVMIGIGGYVGSKLPVWLSSGEVVSGEGVPENVKMAFLVGAGLLIVSILITVLTSKEYSPDELAAYEAADESDMAELRRAEAIKPDPQPGVFIRAGLVILALGLGAVFWIKFGNADKVFSVFAGLVLVTGALFLLNGLMGARRGHFLGDVMGDLATMPLVMKRLAVVQFTSWFAFFIMWIYAVPAVASHHFDSRDAASSAYDAGANAVYGMFGVYNLIPIAMGLLLPLIVRGLGTKATYALGLFGGGVGLALLGLLPLGQYLGDGLAFGGINLFATQFTLSAVLIGIAWSCVLVLPYTILADALPPAKMGLYMGIFNFFIVLPQIIVATLMGPLLKTFLGNDPMNAMLVGGAVMALGAVLLIFVPHKDVKA
jgi:maltose/moltooligosaccharide transporter